MAVREIIARSLQDVIGIVQRDAANTLYRGVGDARHKLLSKVGRCGMGCDAERASLDHFRLFSHSLARERLHTELEWLALGQHHGLITRLLDWSQAALIALFFALEGSERNDLAHQDAALYSIQMPRGLAPLHRLPDRLQSDPVGWGTNYMIDYSANTLAMPLDPSRKDIVTTYLFMPPVISPRIPAQAGVLSISCIPSSALDDYSLDPIRRIRVPAADRRAMYVALLRAGINRQVLFPDMDGVAAHANSLFMMDSLVSRA